MVGTLPPTTAILFSFYLRLPRGVLLFLFLFLFISLDFFSCEYYVLYCTVLLLHVGRTRADGQVGIPVLMISEVGIMNTGSLV